MKFSDAMHLCVHFKLEKIFHTLYSFSISRYLFALQIKRDLAEKKIMCSENTSALLISHILQCEC